MKTTNVLIGTAITAAVGYALADGLARACTYAEEVENTDGATRPPVPQPDIDPRAQAPAGPARPGPLPRTGVTA